ncbi:MAG: phage tail protein [Alphaproteobacteria bacterium]|nr:MAG: phage tail protein [Alphaproteobacteria bacterium]
MPTAYIGDIQAFAFEFLPSGWVACDGTVYNIADYPGLGYLLGDLYGGNGSTTFAVPDLRGRTAIFGSNSAPLGQKKGKPTNTLQSPLNHGHRFNLGAQVGTQSDPEGNFLAQSMGGTTGAGETFFSKEDALFSLTSLHADTVQTAGAGQPFENRQPFLTLNYGICYRGYYPHPGEDEAG